MASGGEVGAREMGDRILAEITMLAVVPTSPTAGVPVSLPVVVLNVSHFGRLLVTLNVTGSPSPSDTDGVKL